MKWDMQMEEVEVVLQKIWDIHDKLSDAIHSVSRSHFLTSVKTLTNICHVHNNSNTLDDHSGSVFIKDFRLAQDDDDSVSEAKSLNAIRTALENLEDHLEVFHTIQTQQRVERDAAITRLEQSRIVLAKRLAEHRGKKYQVIEEALAFVGDVHDPSSLIAQDILYGQNRSSENFVTEKAERSNILINIFVSSFNFVKKSLGLDHMGGIVGNAALVAVSLLALLQLHQVSYHEQPYGLEDGVHNHRTVRRTKLVDSSSDAHSGNLDVLLARG